MRGEGLGVFQSTNFSSTVFQKEVFPLGEGQGEGLGVFQPTDFSATICQREEFPLPLGEGQGEGPKFVPTHKFS